jgi:hypothetical protein
MVIGHSMEGKQETAPANDLLANSPLKKGADPLRGVGYELTNGLPRKGLTLFERAANHPMASLFRFIT